MGHVVYSIAGYDRLVADTQAVLDTLIPEEMELQTQWGLWYPMRIQAYRTIDNVIEGAVITFIDITETKNIQEALQDASNKIRLLHGICPEYTKRLFPKYELDDDEDEPQSPGDAT